MNKYKDFMTNKTVFHTFKREINKKVWTNKKHIFLRYCKQTKEKKNLFQKPAVELDILLLQMETKYLDHNALFLVALFNRVINA